MINPFNKLQPSQAPGVMFRSMERQSAGASAAALGPNQSLAFRGVQSPQAQGLSIGGTNASASISQPVGGTAAAQFAASGVNTKLAGDGAKRPADTALGVGRRLDAHA